jgi:hypothetical protein
MAIAIEVSAAAAAATLALLTREAMDAFAALARAPALAAPLPAPVFVAFAVFAVLVTPVAPTTDAVLLALALATALPEAPLAPCFTTTQLPNGRGDVKETRQRSLLAPPLHWVPGGSLTVRETELLVEGACDVYEMRCTREREEDKLTLSPLVTIVAGWKEPGVPWPVGSTSAVKNVEPSAFKLKFVTFLYEWREMERYILQYHVIKH